MSSLAHLKQLPVSYLKIDGRFVRRIAADRIAESIVSGIARAARTLGVVTIAEHVETAAVVDRLRELDVTLGQGFHLGRPQPLAQACSTPCSKPSPSAPAVRSHDSRIAVLAIASQSPSISAPIIRQILSSRGAAMLKRAFLATALCAWAALAAAETAYVTDSLRLGLHAASDTSDRPFENLVSGTAVEVLERNTNYARVRLADGREGWVKATFLVDSEAGRSARGRARGRDRDARGGRNGSQDGADGRGARARAAHGGAAGEDGLGRDRFRTPCSACRRRTRAHEERLEAYRHTLPLKWVIPAVVVALVAGFFAGPVVARRPDTAPARRLSRVLADA